MTRKTKDFTQWGKLVTETRRRLKVSRCDFARLLGGYDRSAVWAWEVGAREPNPAVKILLVLMSPDYTDDPIITLIQSASADAYKLDAFFAQQTPEED
tara:strand:- start:26900 stop:27193 length:294 start_codon:yes stop_codon:yes gene_type:complete